MPSTPNPPQLQLSLGHQHQAFKRSFTQFGLDVDDVDDGLRSGASSDTSRSGSSGSSTSDSSSSSTSSLSTSSASGNASGSSAGSYAYGSQGADVFGYQHHHHDGERGERSKRARSEGPERDSVSASAATSSTASTLASAPNATTSGPSALSLSLSLNPEVMNGPSLLSLSGDSAGPVLDISAAEDLNTSNGSPAYQSNSNYSTSSPTSTSSGYTLPVLDFGPSTPSVAEFVALRSSSSPNITTSTSVNGRPVERREPPGFANMLSPRSSSPAPPPAVALDMDVAMDDGADLDLLESDDEDPIDLLRAERQRSRSRSSIQLANASASNSTTSSGSGPRLNVGIGSRTTSNGGSSSFLDTARSDAALNAATERLHASVERSRAFDRLLAPLRSGDAGSVAVSRPSARTVPSTGARSGSASRPRTGVLRSIIQQRQGQGQAQRQDVQGYTRPRLPPFDFERNRRQSPFPMQTDPNANTANAPSPRATSTNRYALRRPLSPTIPLTPIDINDIADAHGNDDMAEQDDSAEVESESEEEEEDDVIVDRELTVDPEVNDGTDSSSSSITGSSDSVDVDENNRDAVGNSSRPSIPLPLSLSVSASTHSFGDIVHDIDSAASQISNVRAEQDSNNTARSRFESFFGNDGLDSRLSLEQVGNGSESNAATRWQAALSGARMAGFQTSPSTSTMPTNSLAPEPFRSSPPTSTWTSAAPPMSPSTRPFPSLRLRPTSTWGRSRGTGAERNERDGSADQGTEREEASPIRFGGWPWNGLLNSPVTDGQSSLGSAVSSGMHVQTQAEATENRTQAESPRLQLRPQSPLFPFSLLSSPGPGSGPISTSRADNSRPSGSGTATSPITLLADVDSEMRRIERMVEMDMETTDSTSTSSSSTLASTTGSGENASTLDATSDLENFISSSFVPFRSQPRPSQPTSSRLPIAETPSLLRRPTSGAMNAGSARLPFAGPQNASTPSHSQARPNLPTLRSAILEPPSYDSFAEWLGGASEGSSSRDNATATSIASNLSLSALGSRYRVIRDEQNASRPTQPEFNIQLREAVARRQRELSMSRIGRATDEDDRSLPPLHASRTNLGALRALARQNANARLAGSGLSSRSNVEQLSTSNMPLRDLMRETQEDMERRRRLQNWFPPILEEDRIRQAERNRDRERARVRLDRFIEIQEQLRQQRLSASEQAPSWINAGSRHDLPQPQTRGQEDDLGLRWADNWDDLLGPGNPDSNEAAPTTSTSTEAAAFFASGTSRGSSRHHQPERSSSTSDLQRQRRASSLWDFDDDVPLDLADNPWDNIEMNWDAPDMFGSASRPHTNGSSPPLANPTANRLPEQRGFTSPREDLLQLLLSGRRLQDEDGANTGRRSSTGANSNTTLLGRAPQDPEFSDLPALEQSRVGMWNVSEPRPGVAAAHTTQGRANNAHDSARRSSSLRAASRPPSLPPLQFDRLAGLTGTGTGDDNANVGNRFLNVSGSEARRSLQANGPFPGSWNRPNVGRRVDRRLGESTVDTARSDPENVLQRSNDLALHHAIMLRSVQARQALRESEQRVRDSTTANTSARYSPSRSQGFQQAMNVLGADGMNNNTRQRFNNAFERERGHLQERPLTHQARNEAHVRWGEITDDTDASRSSALTASGHAPRPWVETLRARRRSMSALFAPPPENADTLPPNRARGTGTAGGIGGPGGHAHTHSPSAQAAQFDWFSMNSSNRARLRNRTRLGRTDEDPSPRPFLRLGRNRPNLRNLGDFMRDEDFDTSYEGLLALAAGLGDVKPRSTPAHVIAALPTGLYKDWQSPGCDLRCPICLDDYKDVDPLLKAEPCNHWCHKECFEQWLHTASTCPVCRTKIKPSQRVSTPSPAAGSSRLGARNNTPNAGLPTPANLGDIPFLDDSDDDFESIFRLREDQRSQRNTVGWTRSPPPR